MAANHSMTVNFDTSMDHIRDILKTPSFSSKLRIALKSENPTPTGVWFRFLHGVTFTSWGEKITITLTPLSATTTKVEVLSECGMPTQIIDWGKNKQNVCNIVEYIENSLATTPAPTSIPQQNTQGETKFCINCGKQLVKESNFCSTCGAKQPN